MNFSLLLRTTLAAGALVSALLASSALAAVPTATSVEGLLLSAGGGPAADGNYTVTFAIYAAETGGAPIWSEAGVTVVAKGGQFSYLLGSKTPLVAASLNLQNAWLGVQIGADPELSRRPLGATLFALRAAVAETLECTGCVKVGALDAAVLQPYAKTTDLAPFAKSTDLSAYAKTADLAAYAKSSDLGAYAKSTDLSAYVKAASLAAVAGTGSYTDLSNTPTLAKVATTGDYADLKNAPAIPAVNKLCGTGLFLKGFNADGSINCTAIVAADLPVDAIKTLSNGLLTNQFTDSQLGTTDVAIKDGLGAGVSDTLVFPDVGIAQKITVNMTIANSDLSGVRVELYAPGIATPYILYDGGKTGTTLTAAFNDTTALVSGDLNKDWVGKNIKGSWSVTVKDLKLGGGTGGIDGKFNWGISIQTLSSKKVEITGDLVLDGKIVPPGTSTLGARIANKAGIFVGYDDSADVFRPMPGIIVPFYATGGPVQVSLSLPMYGGSHRSCRPMIDGLAAGLYTGNDTTYKWNEGLCYHWQPGSGIWRMWDPTRVYPGVGVGNHTLTVECLNDSTQGGPQMGNGGAVATAHVIPYDDPSKAEVKVYTVSAIPNQNLPTTNAWATINGLSLAFVAQGGPVRIALSIPMTSGSHSSCRPLIDGTPAGATDIDDLTYTWQEGLQYLASWWNVWTRTRVYKGVTAGAHTLTVQCLTDSAPSNVTNSRVSAQATVMTYLPPTDPSATARVYFGSERKSYGISAGATWTPLTGSASGSGINLKFASTGGPVEIGSSIPLNGGSHSSCRAVIDGAPALASEPDKSANYWQEGLVYVAGSWQMWDRVRVYKGIAAGNHTLWYECHGDAASPSAGHPNMVSSVFVAAYDK